MVKSVLLDLFIELTGLFSQLVELRLSGNRSGFCSSFIGVRHERLKPLDADFFSVQPFVITHFYQKPGIVKITRLELDYTRTHYRYSKGPK